MEGPIIRITERPRPPHPDELELRFSARAVQELEAILTHYPNKKSALLPALWIAQREYGGHLTPEAIAEVAYRLQRSYAEVEGVATFYTMYNLQPLGRYLIQVCTNISCNLCGGDPACAHACPSGFHAAHISTHATLSAVISVFGHCCAIEPCRAQTTFGPLSCLSRHPHRRLSSSPRLRQSSHLHPAVPPRK